MTVIDVSEGLTWSVDDIVVERVTIYDVATGEVVGDTHPEQPHTLRLRVTDEGIEPAWVADE